MSNADNSTLGRPCPKEKTVNLDTNGIPPPSYSKANGKALGHVLMLVFANTQMELDEGDMVAIRDVMNLSIQFHSLAAREAS